MKFEIFHCSQDPVLLSSMFVSFKLRLATDHGLREAHLKVAAAVQIPPGFPSHILSSCIPVPPSLPPGQGRCAVGG